MVRTAVVGAVSLVCTAAGAWAQCLPARAVALSGVPEAPMGPGFGDGTMFTEFAWTVTNSRGQVLYRASHGSGLVTQPGQGVWLAAGEMRTLVAKTGEQAPGLPPGVLFAGFEGLNLGDDGSVVMVAALQGSGVISGTNDRGVWAGRPGDLRLCARLGDPMPGGAAGERLLAMPYKVLVNATGQIAFVAETSRGKTVWRGAPGSTVPVARHGDPAPGTSSTLDLGSLVTSLWLDDAGTVLFTAGFAGTEAQALRSGVWRCDADGGTALVLSGNTGFGGTVRVVSPNAVLGPRGEVLAWGTATFASGEIGPTVWVGPPGAELRLVGPGDGVPGHSPEVRFTTIVPRSLNERGDALVFGIVSGPGIAPLSSYGFWTGRPGAFRFAFRKGGTFPGTNLRLYDLLGGGQNGLGQIVFGTFAQGETGTRLAHGVWDPWTGLHIVAMSGGTVPIGAGSVRVIAQANLSSNSGNTAGDASGFGDTGDAAYDAAFQDGGGAVLVTRVPTCVADHDRSRDVGIPDVFWYLGDWFLGALPADSDADGDVDVVDLFVFLGAWFAGC